MTLQKQSVGLVGANGFIGFAILKALLDQGVVPRALCGPIGNRESFPAGVQFVVCDLGDTERLQAWISGLDLVIHAAGPPSVQRSFEMPKEYVRVHVEGTAAVLHACRIAKVERLVYVSSAEVYGRPDINPVTEKQRLQARSPYAAAKIGAEKMIEAHVESYGLTATILRPFSIYGQNFHADSLLSRIVSTAKKGCVRLRDLRPIRDYCYVADLAAAVLQAAGLNGRCLRVINIGSGVGTSVLDFAELVLQELCMRVAVIEDRVDPRPGHSEILELIADITSAREILGWRPETSLQEGLRRTLSGNVGKS
jgi:nucleoside-diphosphate-sugar epimerase